MGMRPGKAKGPYVGFSAGGSPYSPVWVRADKTFSDLSAPALSNDIELYSLLDNYFIHAVMIETVVQFSGPGISDYKIAVGITGNLTKYHSFMDADLVPGPGVFSFTSVLGIETLSGGPTSLRLSARSLGANLDQAVMGTVKVGLLLSLWK